RSRWASGVSTSTRATGSASATGSDFVVRFGREARTVARRPGRVSGASAPRSATAAVLPAAAHGLPQTLVTRAVAPENVEVRRWWAVAVTFTEIRFPTSAFFTTYDVPVAPAIRTPSAYQWMLFTRDRDQRPGCAVSLLPTVGVPE